MRRLSNDPLDEVAARRAAKSTDPRAQRNRVLKVARHTNSRAYTFIDTPEGKKMVEGYPDGQTFVASVNEAGSPTGAERQNITPLRERPLDMTYVLVAIILVLLLALLALVLVVVL